MSQWFNEATAGLQLLSFCEVWQPFRSKDWSETVLAQEMGWSPAYLRRVLQEELETEKADLELTKQEMDATQAEMDAKRAEADALLVKLVAKGQEFEEQIEDSETIQDELMKEIEKL